MAGDAQMSTKPSQTGSQNMLGELQKEISQEEDKSSKLIKPEGEAKKQEDDNQLITEEVKE